MLRQIGEDLRRGGVATGNADRQRSDALTTDLIDARRQQRDVNGKLTRQARHDRVAGVAANKDTNDSLPTRDRLFLQAARERDRHRIAKDFCKESLRDRVLWMCEDVGDMPSFDYITGVDDDDLLGELPDDRHFVGDQDDGHAEFAVDVGEQIKDRPRGLRIERRGRLVRQQHAGPRRQCARDADTLFLTAGSSEG
jgi:hypothetical protein